MATEPMTLILAEDDEGHASLVQRNLRRAGFVNEMVHVKDGQEALDYIRAEGDHAERTITDFVLLLLDINMPEARRGRGAPADQGRPGDLEDPRHHAHHHRRPPRGRAVL